MVVTSSIRALIREGKTHQIPTAIQTGKNEGMILMQKSLSSMISQGIIEKEEVLKYTQNKI
jgi:twitching motility protein PilT